MTEPYHLREALVCACIAVLCASCIYLQLNATHTSLFFASQLSLVVLELVIIQIFYRLSLHPLAKYPGPLLAACTDWYTVYWIASGERHLELHRQHKKYGKYVRYGPSRLSINSALASKDLHSVNSNTFKSNAYSSFKRFFGAEMSLTTSDHKIHAFRRRVNAKALSRVTITNFEPKVKPHVDILVNKIAQSCLGKEHPWSSAQNMAHLIAYCVADIMGDITFSQHWNVQLDEKNRHFVHDLPKGVAGIHLVGHMQSLFRFNLHSIIFSQLIQGVTQLMTLSRNFADNRAKEPEGNDIWASLLASRDPKTGKGFSHDELVSEASLFIIGGTDGMITAITATLFYLVHNPHTLDRLTNAIRKSFSVSSLSHNDGSEGLECPIRFASQEVQDIAYLVACIDEAMRLSPPVPSILPRVVGPGGIFIDGEYFPAGVDLGIPHYSLHRDPEYFPQPLLYNPERWLQEEEVARALSDVQRTSILPGTVQALPFTPFGAGRSSCIGKQVAYHEMSYILARLLWQFDIRLDPNNGHIGEGTGTGVEGRERKDEFQLSCRFVSQQEGPVLQFKMRDDGRAVH
ncbi:cytochrome P450 [Xylaria longipes]|nr:cytochrome P450 [Xylaria longipes]